MKWLILCLVSLSMTVQAGSGWQQLSERCQQLQPLLQGRIVTVVREGTVEQFSGVVISKSGHLLTHYLERHELKPIVIFADGRRSRAEAGPATAE